MCWGKRGGKRGREGQFRGGGFLGHVVSWQTDRGGSPTGRGKRATSIGKSQYVWAEKGGRGEREVKSCPYA